MVLLLLPCALDAQLIDFLTQTFIEHSGVLDHGHDIRGVSSEHEQREVGVGIPMKHAGRYTLGQTV